MAANARAIIARMRARIPGATILIYDNYNALAIGFGAGGRASDSVMSIALYPRWASLFFMRGAELADPHGLLKGSGSRIRHVPAVTPEGLDDPRVESLIAEALRIAAPPIDPQGEPRVIIKSVSAKQRPHRP